MFRKRVSGTRSWISWSCYWHSCLSRHDFSCRYSDNKVLRLHDQQIPQYGSHGVLTCVVFQPICTVKHLCPFGNNNGVFNSLKIPYTSWSAISIEGTISSCPNEMLSTRSNAKEPTLSGETITGHCIVAFQNDILHDTASPKAQTSEAKWHFLLVSTTSGLTEFFPYCSSQGYRCNQ